MKQFPTLAEKLPSCLAEKSSSLFWFEKTDFLRFRRSEFLHCHPRAWVSLEGNGWGLRETKESYPIKRQDFRTFLQNGEEFPAKFLY